MQHTYTAFNSQYRSAAFPGDEGHLHFNEEEHKGNKAAFEQLDRKQEIFETITMQHTSTLYGVAMKLTQDSFDAENLVQETFMKAFKFFEKYTLGTNCRAWLFKIMYNTFINNYNRKSRSPVMVYLENFQFATEEITTDRGYISDTEDHVFSSIFNEEVSIALNKIPVDFKMPILMADVKDFSYEEISNIMDIPIGTVKSRIFRGRRMLREMLDGYGKEHGYVREKSMEVVA